MIALHLLFYYILAFLQEEELLASLRSGGFRHVWQKSRLCSLEFCLLYYPWIYFFCSWLPKAAWELRLLCVHSKPCRTYLSMKRAWMGWTQDGIYPFPMIDNGEIQWRDFRDSLPILLPAAVVTVVIRRLLVERMDISGDRDTTRISAALLVGGCFLLVLHGTGSAFVLAYAGLFYTLGRLLAGGAFCIPMVWLAAAVCIAVADHRILPEDSMHFGSLLGPSAAFLDAAPFTGVYHWSHSIKLMLLRSMSFVLDWHWALSSGRPGEGRYTFLNSLTHLLYAPTFLAGPIITFDDFVDQCRSAKPPGRRLVWYLLQLVIALAMAESAWHLYFVFAMARVDLLREMKPRLAAAAVFLTLNMMWLKFLCMWRFGRAWAMADGVEVPENMRRCMCNNFSLMGFWRGWHSSFNRWLVRYLYVPLGGARRKMAASAATFLFVAAWHDLEFKLMAWGLLNVGFLWLEGAVAARPGPWPRAIVGIAGSTYILVLMTVNLIGYSTGLAGLIALLPAATQWQEALWVLAGAYLTLFGGIQVMLELRKLDGTAKEVADLKTD